MFASVRWKKEFRSLQDPHVPFYPSPQHNLNVANRYIDDYEMILFLQSTQAWRWKVQEE